MTIDLFDRRSTQWDTSWIQIDGLVNYLDAVWQDRPRFPYRGEGIEESPSTQKFFVFEKNTIEAKNYVGFLQFQDLRINVYPRVFYQHAEFSPSLAIQHMIKWLGYSDRIHFPFSKIALDTSHCKDWLDAFIFLFASFTEQSLNTCPYFSYHEVTEEMNFVRGRIAMPEYLRNNILKGRHQNVFCTYEPFLYDNLFNRIVKYTSRLLLNFTEDNRNIELLNNILFILTDVEDIFCSGSDCDKVATNRLYPEIDIIRNMCQMFLQHSSIGHYNNRQNCICFFLPMEVIFEQYISGFIQCHFPAYRVSAQADDTFLANTGDNYSLAAFQMRHDILIPGKMIIDTKYKFRQLSDDNKNGVSQLDMYQIICYCFKRNLPHGLMLYPAHKESGANNKAVSYLVKAPAMTIYVQVNSIDITEDIIEDFEESQIKKFTDLLADSIPGR